MARALLTLVGGVLVTLLAAALLTPGVLVNPRGFALVLLTVLAGAAVMAVVVRRASARDELQRIEEQRQRPDQWVPGGDDHTTTDDSTDVTADQHRGGVDEGTDRG